MKTRLRHGSPHDNREARVRYASCHYPCGDLSAGSSETPNVSHVQSTFNPATRIADAYQDDEVGQLIIIVTIRLAKDSDRSQYMARPDSKANEKYSAAGLENLHLRKTACEIVCRRRLTAITAALFTKLEALKIVEFHASFSFFLSPMAYSSFAPVSLVSTPCNFESVEIQ